MVDQFTPQVIRSNSKIGHPLQYGLKGIVIESAVSCNNYAEFVDLVDEKVLPVLISECEFTRVALTTLSNGVANINTHSTKGEEKEESFRLFEAEFFKELDQNGEIVELVRKSYKNDKVMYFCILRPDYKNTLHIFSFYASKQSSITKNNFSLVLIETFSESLRIAVRIINDRLKINRFEQYTYLARPATNADVKLNHLTAILYQEAPYQVTIEAPHQYLEWELGRIYTVLQENKKYLEEIFDIGHTTPDYFLSVHNQSYNLSLIPLQIGSHIQKVLLFLDEVIDGTIADESTRSRNLSRLMERLFSNKIQDTLTGLLNKDHSEICLQQAITTSKPSQLMALYSVCLQDIAYWHILGSGNRKVLRQVASVIKDAWAKIEKPHPWEPGLLARYEGGIFFLFKYVQNEELADFETEQINKFVNQQLKEKKVHFSQMMPRSGIKKILPSFLSRRSRLATVCTSALVFNYHKVDSSEALCEHVKSLLVYSIEMLEIAKSTKNKIYIESLAD